MKPVFYEISLSVMAMSTSLMPVIFWGHGNPLNALPDQVFEEQTGSVSPYAKNWAAMGQRVPKPMGILSISAHWYISATAVTGQLSPRTIHDFSGFPAALYQMHYPAPGSPELARRVQQLLDPVSVVWDQSWGLDHGTWSVLCHGFPEADIPVVQLSLDRTQPPEFHYKLAQRLAPLRQEGILVMGSGNLVHNLSTYGWGQRHRDPYDWAVRFEAQAKDWILKSDHEPLINYHQLGQDAALSIPTPEHYLPLLYVLGLRQPEDPVSFPVTGVDGGSVSMLSIQLG